MRLNPKQQVYVKIGLVAALVVVLALAYWAFVEAQGPQIVNGDFEGGFSVRESQEVVVANGWDYSYLSGDDRWCRAPCYRPEYKPETAIVVQGTSQRWFATFARQFGTIHQLVRVDSDQWYTFECQVYAISEPDGQQAVFVGINPWGAGVFDRTMVWGEQQPWGSYRQWHTLSVTTRAYGGQIRVAVGSNNNYPTKNSAAYVDQCVLRRADGPVQPTQTPRPTYTPYPTPAPCPTCPANGECQCATADDVRTVIREELDAREPVRWPR